MATYKVPALVQVKATPISVSKDAYTNPQPQYNAAAEQYLKAAQQVTQSALGYGQRRSEYLREEKAANERLNANAANSYVNETLSIAGIGNTGSSKFDQNKLNYFLDQKKTYGDIVRMIMERPELAASGSQELAKIQEGVASFKQAAPLMLTQIALMNDAIRKKGIDGLSSIFPDAYAHMLRAISGEGNANVTLVNQGGRLGLFAEQQEYKDVNGDFIKLPTTFLDINKFLTADVDGQSIPIIEDWKPEVREASKDVLSYAGNPDQPNPFYIDSYEQPSITGGSIDVIKNWKTVDTMLKPIIGSDKLKVGELEFESPWAGQTLDGKQAAMEAMINGNAFTSIINSRVTGGSDMEIWWADIIGTDTDGRSGQDTDWDPNDPEKVKIAALWFAEQGIEAYSNSLGVQATYKAPSTGGGNTGTQADRDNLKKFTAVSQGFFDAHKAYAENDFDNILPALANLNIDGMSVIQDPDGTTNEDFMLVKDPTATGAQAEKLKFNIRQPNQVNMLLQEFGLVGTKEGSGTGDFSLIDETIDYAPKLKNVNFKKLTGKMDKKSVKEFINSEEFDIPIYSKDGKTDKTEKMTITELISSSVANANKKEINFQSYGLRLPNGTYIRYDSEDFEKEFMEGLRELYHKDANYLDTTSSDLPIKDKK